MAVIKKYARGKSGRGKEVINELLKFGGKCDNSEINGEFEQCIYYIRPDDSTVDYVSLDSPFGMVLISCFEEIKLPDTDSEKSFNEDELFREFINRGFLEKVSTDLLVKEICKRRGSLGSISSEKILEEVYARDLQKKVLRDVNKKDLFLELENRFFDTND